MDRKEKTRRYRETPRPAGVYQVVHRSTGRVLLGASVDVPAMLNRIRAQLDLASHPNRQLQIDWDTDGADGFEFAALDVLPPADDPGQDIRKDLETLLALWKDRLDSERILFY